MVLHPALGPQPKKDTDCWRVQSAEGHKDDRGLKHLSRMRELELFSLEKTLRRTYCTFPMPKGSSKSDGRVSIIA